MEVILTALGNHVVKESHGFNNLPLDLTGANNVIIGKEVGGYGNQSLLGPAAEPVHGAARNQAGELERPGPELLANLWRARSEDMRNTERGRPAGGRGRVTPWASRVMLKVK